MVSCNTDKYIALESVLVLLVGEIKMFGNLKCQVCFLLMI